MFGRVGTSVPASRGCRGGARGTAGGRAVAGGAREWRAGGAGGAGFGNRRGHRRAAPKACPRSPAISALPGGERQPQTPLPAAVRSRQECPARRKQGSESTAPPGLQHTSLSLTGHFAGGVLGKKNNAKWGIKRMTYFTTREKKKKSSLSRFCSNCRCGVA